MSQRLPKCKSLQPSRKGNTVKEEAHSLLFSLRRLPETRSAQVSPGFLALQLTILTLSACTVWLPLSILKVTFLMRNVQTSSQNRYVSRLPYSRTPVSPSLPPYPAAGRTIHLELQTALDVLLERLGDGLVEVGQDLHRQLRADVPVADEIVERVRQSEADAIPQASLLASRFSPQHTADIGDGGAVPAASVQLVERLRASRHDCGWP